MKLSNKEIFNEFEDDLHVEDTFQFFWENSSSEEKLNYLLNTADYYTLKGRVIHFENFGHDEVGIEITSYDGMAVVFAANPYGSGNLILVDKDQWQSWCHGTDKIFDLVESWFPTKTYRKLLARWEGR